MEKVFSYLEATERWPSAAARNQHSSLEQKAYLRNRLSRRQLQGFVRCALDVPLKVACGYPHSSLSGTYVYIAAPVEERP